MGGNGALSLHGGRRGLVRGALAVPLPTSSHLGGEGTEAPNLLGPPLPLVWGRGEEDGRTFPGAVRWAWKRVEGGAAAERLGHLWAEHAEVGVRTW